MIWTEDEILAGGLGIGGNGSQQSVDMTLAEDIGAEMVEMGLPGAGQGMDDGRGGVLMEEDEILPVVVVETVVVPAQQPASPVVGFGLGQRLQHQQQQQQQQQQGGVRFNPTQQSNSNSGCGSSGGSINSLNRIRSFSKVESLTPRTNSTAAFLAAAAHRNGAEKSRPQPPPPAAGPLTVQRGAGAEVGAGVGGGIAQDGATIASVATEEEKPGDMEIDAPESVSTKTTDSGPGSESVQDVQSTGPRENQDTAQPSSSLLSQPIATSVLEPALELKSAEAPSESMSGAHPAVAIGPGAESLAVTDTESMAQPVAVKAEVAESTTEGPASVADEQGTEPMVVDPPAGGSDMTEPMTESLAMDQPSVPQPPVTATTDAPEKPLTTTTTPSSPSPSTPPPSPSTTKPPKGRRRPPVPVQHHPSWHFAPGSDIAFLSEMKRSDADLKRFRREHEWLEERVRRPKRDRDSDLLLDRALGLTRMVVVPPLLAKGYGVVKDGEEKKEMKEIKDKDGKVVVSKMGSFDTQESKDKDGGEGEKGGKDITTNNSTTKATNTNTNTQSNNRYITPVRLSTDTRLAFSILKTNLSAELEEQIRLETDQRILEQIVERTATKLSTTAQLHSQAEERLRELQTRQPDQERELVKLEKLERACMELRERQRQQAEEEIRQLEETVRLLESQRELKRREDVRRAERQRSEMERVASPAVSSAAAATTAAH